ncbi:MAG: S41 family peptidase [Prevotellaceae bacterium]|jgi:carboxyl-terminal processing protease|nr:S41 family peptidase [Prevotellaceae bacterium]
MNKSKFLGPALALAIALLALYTGTNLGKAISRSKYIANQNNLSILIEYVSRYYVDTVDVRHLTESAIVDILKELDPHSIYIPASELKSSNEHLEGNFEGIGVTFRMLNDTVLVINVIPEGPSSRAGVYPGDRIVTVDDSVIAGKKIPDEAVKSLLRGKSGSKVQVKVRRKNEKELLPLEITRGKVILKSINVAYMIAPNTGYIRMTGFAQNTHSEFVETVDRLHSEGMTALILDLRDNTGGFLDQAIKITNELFADRKLIVYTEGRAFPRRNEYSRGNGKCGNDSIVILINEHSASASEILAGAVQDNDRGIIVGQRSFGKGLVQQMIELPDKSGLRLTTARYYTPSGRSIQRPYQHGASGIVNYYNELNMRGQNGEYDSADSIRPTDTTKYYTSKGRIVYGGGGITPDTFVAYEYNNRFVRRVINSVMTEYIMIFSDKHRNELNTVKELSQLERFFEKNNPYPGFNEFLKKKNISHGNDDDMEESKTLLDLYLKVYISETTPLYALATAFLLNKFDKTVQKALEITNTQNVKSNV